MPEIGFQLNETWAFGGIVGFSNTEERVGQVSTRFNNTFLTPFARYSPVSIAGYSFYGQGE